ncbi:BrnT family toxin [Granulicella arctica]|uniref:BrnT family toxin n=1 Tax=Granulicella arctica TaxID=940613 RepID=UPI0021E0C6FC|nr:BrnT family toxin [Granulicella arctica]
MREQRSHLHLLQGMYFEWDRKKAIANKQKHGVAFEEAATVFKDEDAKVYSDPDHSDD